MAAARHHERPAIVLGAESRSWAQVHAMSIELARRLPPTGELLNLCASRLGFLVAWLAALRSGRPMWLPPSSGRADCVEWLQGRASPCVMLDEEQGLDTALPTHACCLVPGFRSGSTTPATVPVDLSWQPSWDAPAVVLHTSGSTGTPTPHAKTLLQLAMSALALGERLWPAGPPPQTVHLLSSVVPSHMFGFEASVMLPLVYALPVVERRPLFAADLEQAAAWFADGDAASDADSDANVNAGAGAGAGAGSGSDAPTAPDLFLDHSAARPFVCAHAGQPQAPRAARSFLWIATPMHLHSLARSTTRLEHCSGVVCSTMPLSADTATRVEALAGTRVLEVYGSTETGALATRRTSSDIEWSPLNGVIIGAAVPSKAGHGRCTASGAHFDSPVTLADSVAVSVNGTFTLLGRDGDLLKIGGHRASLASLNLLLLEMPGLDDGVMFVPDAVMRRSGTSAAAASSALTADSARACTESAAAATATAASAAIVDGTGADRLCLIYSSDVLDQAQIERWWRQRVAAPFLPRTFIAVDRLPRNESGKVSHAALNALYRRRLDRRGRFDVVHAHDHPALAGHFPGRPIVPGVLLLAAMLSGVTARTGRSFTALEQARFIVACRPDEIATIRFEVDEERCRIKATALRADQEVVLVSVTALDGTSA